MAHHRSIRTVASLALASLLMLGVGVVSFAQTASASTSVTLYAYSQGTTAGTGNNYCQDNADSVADCSLSAALALPGISPGTDVTISLENISGLNATFDVTDQVLDLQDCNVTIQGGGTLDGQNSSQILQVNDSIGGGSLTIKSLIFRNALAPTGGALLLHTSDTTSLQWVDFTNNQATSDGGAIANYPGVGVNLNLSAVNFTNNRAGVNGGAIDLADATATISALRIDANSTFSGNSAGFDGGAIDAGDNAGYAEVIASAFFSDNQAGLDGGAIDIADNGGRGIFSDTYSWFSSNTAGLDGGAMDIADNGGTTSAASLSGETIAVNAAGKDGGAIDVADHAGNGALSLTSATSTGNSALINGGAIDAADFGGIATLTISSSFFLHNSANINNASGFLEAGDGGAIDIADGEDDLDGAAISNITSSVFTSNDAHNCGGAIDSGDSGTSTLTVDTSTFTSNISETGAGGAINSGDTAAGTNALTVYQSIFSYNSGGDFGGAIATAAKVGTGTVSATVTESFFRENASVDHGTSGGAISNGSYGGVGTLTVGSSTFDGNGVLGGVDSGDRGSAIFNGSTGTTIIYRSTIASGDASTPALYNKNNTYLAGDIITGDESQLCDNSAGSIVSKAYNLEKDASSCGLSSHDGQTGDLAGVKPLLGDLDTTTGPTPFFPLTQFSPAYQIIPSGASFTVSSASIVICGSAFSDQTATATPSGACSLGAVQRVLNLATDTVTYALNGGRGTTPTHAAAMAGGTIVVAGATGFSRSGYLFEGWSDGTATYGAGATYVLHDSPVHFTAVWTAKSKATTPTCTITFTLASHHISTRQGQIVESCARTIAQDHVQVVSLIGFTNPGTKHRALAQLAQARAQAVALLLTHDLSTLGYDKITVHVLVGGTYASHTSLNGRRVDVLL